MKNKQRTLVRPRLPFVTVKFAQSLDGRIATSTGDSKWISGPQARKFGHQLRREHDAVLVGIGTVLADDPELTVRLVTGRNPLRIVVDSRLRIPLAARVVNNPAGCNTIIATLSTADPRRVERLRRRGVQVLLLPQGKKHAGVDLRQLLRRLDRMEIGSVLVEGGSAIITSLLAARLVDRVVAVTSPKIIGRGTEAVGNLGIAKLSDAITFSSVKTRMLGSDFIFDARIR
ncbi:MAG TPA: RibD family protein [Blastocatellia bacterium]|nr:RibD family protein [Blastocatellia bacterium]